MRLSSQGAAQGYAARKRALIMLQEDSAATIQGVILGNCSRDEFNKAISTHFNGINAILAHSNPFEPHLNAI